MPRTSNVRRNASFFSQKLRTLPLRVTSSPATDTSSRRNARSSRSSRSTACRSCSGDWTAADAEAAAPVTTDNAAAALTNCL